MKVLLVDNGTTLLEKLETLIPGEEIVRKFDAFKANEAGEYDLTILSGGSIYSLIGNEEKFTEELGFIRNTQKPLIGICFGCELITSAFGGSLKRLENEDRGIKEIDILSKDFYSKPIISVYESHEWGIDRLPNDFEIIAKSDIGPQIIKHKTLSIYGLQFHPENLVDKSDGDELFLKILADIK